MEQLIMAGGGLQIATAFGKRSITRAGADIQNYQSEVEAQQEELGAVSREADRKHRLAYALSSQIAEAGVSGVSIFEGSPLKIIEADIEAEGIATGRDEFQTKLAALTKRTQGKVNRSLMKRGADLTLMSDISGTAMQGASALGAAKAPAGKTTGTTV